MRLIKYLSKHNIPLDITVNNATSHHNYDGNRRIDIYVSMIKRNDCNKNDSNAMTLKEFLDYENISISNFMTDTELTTNVDEEDNKTNYFFSFSVIEPL